MKKRISTLLLALMFVFTLIPVAEVHARSATAQPSAHTATLDGSETHLEADLDGFDDLDDNEEVVSIAISPLQQQGSVNETSLLQRRQVMANATNDSSHLPIVNGLPDQQTLSQWVDAWPGLTDFERYLFQFINEYRAENGLHALELCPTLSALAWYRTSYLNRNGFVRADVQTRVVHRWGSHTTADVASLVRDLANDGRFSVGANFNARNAQITAYAQARVTVDGWIGSPGHRANMVNEASTVVGIGSALSVDGNRTYAYTFFGVADNQGGRYTATVTVTLNGIVHTHNIPDGTHRFNFDDPVYYSVYVINNIGYRAIYVNGRRQTTSRSTLVNWSNMSFGASRPGHSISVVVSQFSRQSQQLPSPIITPPSTTATLLDPNRPLTPPTREELSEMERHMKNEINLALQSVGLPALNPAYGHNDIARLLVHGTSVFDVGVSTGNMHRLSYNNTLPILRSQGYALRYTTLQNLVRTVQNRPEGRQFTHLSVYLGYNVAPNGTIGIRGYVVLISL